MQNDESGPTQGSVPKTSVRGRDIAMVGMILAMFMACMDSTIVSTCGPLITKDLGGEDIYSWIITAYLLCETIMIPISGKLSDMYGRKPFFLIGLALFTGGSFLAGVVTEMDQFIACRAIQGVGGGILIPVATSAIGDMYEGEARAKMQGLAGAVFGIGSGMGPLVGGYVSEYISWHWIFFINIPIAFVALYLVLRHYRSAPLDHDTRVDIKGITVLSVFLLDILLFFEWVGKEFDWISVESAIMLAVAAVTIALFVFVERRACSPILSPELVRNRVVLQSAAFMFVFGLALFGSTTYVAYLGINVLGYTVLEAGQYAMSMVVGMMITSIGSGALLSRTGYRPWLVFGPLCAGIGLFMASRIGVDTTVPFILVALFIFGLGLGCIMSVITTAVQNSSRDDEMGMTTSSVNLIRNIGSTTGTAIFAMIINNSINSKLLEYVPDPLLPEIYDMIPHDTSLIVLKRLPGMEMYTPMIMEILTESVDLAFVVAGVILVLLVPLGLIYSAKVVRDSD